jgi:excisionase family DNA binding protein
MLPEGQMVNEPAISIQRLAERLDVSQRTARRIIRAGGLRAHRIGRQWRVFEGDLQAYLARQSNRQTGRHVGSEGHAE